MRDRILIIDDSMEDRKEIADAIGNRYGSYQAGSGRKGLEMLVQYEDEVALVILDLDMPEVDGFRVLQVMEEKKVLKRIPVIMVTDYSNPELVAKLYEKPVSGVYGKPIDAKEFLLGLRTAMRYAGIVDQQDRFSANVLDMFGDIVEGRDLGGAVHIEHIKNMTRALAEHLMTSYPEYKLSRVRVNEIVEASALHDIGKVAIPDHVLNKPGKLTSEEFDLMKSHTTKGGEMIERMASVLSIVHPYDAENFVQIAYDICRHHHERYDGRGYPDRQSGEDIPIAAQIVSISDTLDGMTGRTVYKRAIEKEKAFHMIVTGEAGVFNPKLLECLKQAKDRVMDIIGEQDLH
ncbi:MAG: response regulator [Lachnospiraceae bacterium]|nr:response regulator [Lachnospiraceae bacterium]